MNIGFDLDGVFIAGPPFIPSFVIDLFYRKRTKKLAYRFPSKTEQKLRRLTHTHHLRPLITKNAQLLHLLSQQNAHKRYIISSRFSFLEDITSDLVKRYVLDKHFHEIVLNTSDQQPHRFKHEMIHRYAIDVFVDDDLPLIEYLAKKNPKVKFYWFNKSQDAKLKNNLFAITHLSAIVR